MTALTLSPETQGHLAALSATARRVSTIGAGLWTTPVACRKARADLDLIIADAKAAKRGIPK